MTGDPSVSVPQPNPSDFAAVDEYIAGLEGASGITDELARRYSGSDRSVQLPGTLGGDDRLEGGDDPRWHGSTAGHPDNEPVVHRKESIYGKDFCGGCQGPWPCPDASGGE